MKLKIRKTNSVIDVTCTNQGDTIDKTSVDNTKYYFTCEDNYWSVNVNFQQVNDRKETLSVSISEPESDPEHLMEQEIILILKAIKAASAMLVAPS